MVPPPVMRSDVEELCVTLVSRSVVAFRRPNGSVVAMARTKAASSRAIATLTTLTGFPVLASRRCLAHSRTAFSRRCPYSFAEDFIAFEDFGAHPRRQSIGPGAFHQDPSGARFPALVIAPRNISEPDDPRSA